MTLDSLFEQLKHPNPNLRKRAMLEIAEVRDETTIHRLMNNLEAEDVVYRRASVKTLGVIGTDAVSPLVESLLNSDNPTVRSSCAKALAQIIVNYPEVPLPSEGIEGLKKAINDPNPVVYIAAIMALGEVGSPTLDLLLEVLQTTDNVAIAVTILNALGSMGDPRAIETLTQLTNDESVDPYVRESAVSALSRLEMVMNYNQA
ncbi:PBS lyase HEAT domain protein repeat-containing protein [Stanieria cyanosphaera PCC 7437]|uniref:PBS lyase HEAT domain protein repeat-containing protein n=1 Tax=Stanieria cyanosphaera (strain ATCC 29371 / PCC 7437) TaxID=111780 RepID=K9XXM6_STAC7|nr:HEAT repeat domain-containing protein [Stanieria cyanosphaera]AFZ36856.1 PBS lyase HEAT domain protein repeat-containing protein [Stanieria cyanosphaera PCC 7437]